jgi:hypothetical protein
MLYAKKNRDLSLYLYLFFIFNIVLLFCLTLYSYSNKNLEKNYVQVELKRELSEEALQNTEKAILSLKEVKKIRYLSKEESLENLSKELGTAVRSDIPDLFVVSITDLEGAIKLESTLESDVSVATVHINENSLNKVAELNRKIKMGIYVILTVISLPLMVIIAKIHVGMVKNNFLFVYLKAQDRKKRDEILKRAKKFTLIPTLLIGIFSVGVTFAAYYLLKYFDKSALIVQIFSNLEIVGILSAATLMTYLVGLISGYLVRPEEKRGK